MAENKTPVVLYRGLSANFDPGKHGNGIYFATDCGEIYVMMPVIVDGETKYEKRIYGSKDIITNVIANGDGNNIDVTLQSGETKSIDITKFNVGTKIEYVKKSDSGEGKPLLVLKNGNDNALSSIDISDFVRDGILESVTIEMVNFAEEGQEEDLRQCLVFTWNTDSGKEDKTVLEVSNIIGNVNIDASNVTLGKKLIVAGLQKDSQLGAGNITNNKEYSETATIYEILSDLLCKELWPESLSISDGSLISTYSGATLSLSNDVTDKTVEVGSNTTLTLGTDSINLTYSANDRKWSGFDNGYYVLGEDKKFSDLDQNSDNKSDNPVEKIDGNPSNIAITDIKEIGPSENSPYKISWDFTNFKVRNTDGVFVNASDGNVSISNESNYTFKELLGNDTINEAIRSIPTGLYIAEGENKLTVTVEGPGHSGKTSGSPTYYGVSNLGYIKNANKDENGEYKISVAEKEFNTTPSSTNSSIKTTGAYYNIYQVSSTAGITAVTSSSQATDSSINNTTDKKYKTFNRINEIKISKDTVAEIVILSKTLTVKGAMWNSPPVEQNWMNYVTNETDAVDFTLPDGSKVKYNKTTIIVNTAGDKFSSDGTLKLTYN